MSRFFFDFRQGDARCPDAQGMEFGSVEQAYLEAFKGAQDMWSELLRRRQDPSRCTFEVRNAGRELLFVLPFQEVIDSCHDRGAAPTRDMLDYVTRNASHTKRLSKSFAEELRAIRKTLDQSHALLRTKI